jgi:glycosyltransferase involved in cell wall biosynthesis
MKIAFVTPRYGEEVMGGAEGAARSLAEHLVADLGHEVEIYTTCATDHLSWADVLSPGVSQLHGVTVRRFTSTAGRDPKFSDLDARIRVAPSSRSIEDSVAWVAANGPVSESLVEALGDCDADVVAFYPYLFYMSVHGITRVRQPAVLHPAAHDEPSLYLPIFQRVFDSADAICFHTEAERSLVEPVLHTGATDQIVLGLGTGQASGSGRDGAAILGIAGRPYLVSVGRVDEQKGSTMLYEYFVEYKKRHPGPLALALVGPVSRPLPEHPDVVAAGIVDEADKWDIVAGAEIAISPSAMESFSLVVLEAWVARRAVMVNAVCGPTMEHIEASGGGLSFEGYLSFEVTLERLLGDATLREHMGEQGARYVASRYDWPVLIRRYEAFLESVVARGRRSEIKR